MFKSRGKYEKEVDLENYFKRECAIAGFITRKFTSPGRRGVTDQIVMARGSLCAFVEIKHPKGLGRLSKLQELERTELRGGGVICVNVQSVAQVDSFIDFFISCSILSKEAIINLINKEGY